MLNGLDPQENLTKKLKFVQLLLLRYVGEFKLTAAGKGRARNERREERREESNT